MFPTPLHSSLPPHQHRTGSSCLDRILTYRPLCIRLRYFGWCFFLRGGGTGTGGFSVFVIATYLIELESGGVCVYIDASHHIRIYGRAHAHTHQTDTMWDILCVCVLYILDTHLIPIPFLSSLLFSSPQYDDDIIVQTNKQKHGPVWMRTL